MKIRTTQKRSQTRKRTLKQYLAASWSAATQKAYASDLAQFKKWGGRVPTTPRTLARYLAEHAETLAFATLGRRLAAINHAHRAAGYASPVAHDLVRSTLRGIRRTHRPKQRQAAPLLQRDLRQGVRTAPGLRGLRDRTLLLVGFCGGFRASELVGLDVSDLEFVRRGVLVTLRKSKTDQEGKGRRVPIPYARERGNCAVRVLQAWMGRAAINAGPLFRAIDRHGVVSDRGLSMQVVSLVVKRYVALLGKEPQRYSAHSLRAGFVTSAAAAGVPSWRIRQQTGHKSDAMLARYIRPGDAFSGHALLSLF